MVKIKRVYEKPVKDDGYRVLVDRLWPRGLSKDKAGVDLWLKEIGPSNELRKWFSHDPVKWVSFKRKYEFELKSQKGLLGRIKQLQKVERVITLLYAAKNEECNNAVVLKEILCK